LALSTPIAIPGGEVSLSLSAGIALASEAGRSPEELLAAADRAMYVAKRSVV
jgi:GGDEF domain-containing protein